MTRFSLFDAHLDLAHNFWTRLVCPGDVIIDATCGNGHDTLFLAKLALKEDLGQLIALDAQHTAIESCQNRLREALAPNIFDRILFFEGCHSTFPSLIEKGTVKLIAYNLGYLPGGDKNITTQAQTTLQSIQAAQSLIQMGGVISITCYPGHAAGKVEESELMNYISSIDKKEWSSSQTRWLNRKTAPSLIFLQKITN